MSRIGKKPVVIPAGVNVELKGKDLHVKGKLGSENLTLTEGFEAKVENNQLIIVNKVSESDKKYNALHGLYRSLIANMLKGVSDGFEKDLEIIGVGYRVNAKGKGVEFQLGFSHNVPFDPPAGITIEVIDQTKLKVKGINKELVGQIAADIRKLRPPEPYKGKGIRYKGEYVRKKAGKAGKK
jgi:large subunit ribosomal protein L6